MAIHWNPTMQAADLTRRRDLGGKLWLWTQRQWALSDKVIISSHGGMMTSGVRTFQVLPTETFYFYSVQGQGAKASSLGSATYENTATERVGPGPCPNYTLSKFQGDHGGPNGERLETYGSIQQIQAQKDTTDTMFNNAFAEYGPAAAMRALGGNMPGGVQWQVGDQRQDFDVLTVRNRFYSSSVTLEYAVRKLRELHNYREIHCAFCRT